MNSLNQDWQKKQFSIKGNSVSAWCMNAYPLLAGARVLNKNNNPISHINKEVLPDEACTMSAMFLLYGFALESLLKACYLKKGGKLVVNDKFKPIKNVSMHNLVDLAKAADVQLSDIEYDVLRKLSIQIVSFARYPIGKKFSDESSIKTHCGRITSPNSFNSQAIKIIEEVVKNIGVIVGLDFSNSSFTPIEE